MNICFIADYFVDEIPGGGELNNEEFINIVKKKGHHVIKIKSEKATVRRLENLVNYKFVVANFVEIPRISRKFLLDKTYVIYEHDHKYLEKRNPALFENFKAPKEKIINRIFYEKAATVLCQSKFHKEIINKNLNLNNIINLSGNIWPDDILDLITKYSKNKKTDTHVIMNSVEPHKNTRAAVRYCQYKNLDYNLISHCRYRDFLKKISYNKSFVFFPQTPETLCRAVVEARMMGMKVITNNLVGAAGEEWFALKGQELIDFMREKKKTIVDLVLEKLDENTSNLK
jgi:hypothetical protein